ncbi:MAG: YitT family protein [Clostridia bacterium]|nr:YitT family protein [Clostridia bacterium]
MISRRLVGRCAALIAGAAVLAFGMYNIHSQSRITEGGVLGMTLLIQHWTGISPAVSEAVLDVICYGLGLKYLGKGFLGSALLATGAYSAFYALNERIGYVLPDLSAQPLLAALTGALFVGVGVGIVVRAGGAACGDDALALVLSKLLHTDVPRIYLFSDLTVLTLSLSYIPFINIAYSLVTVMLSSFIIGRILAIGEKNPKK